MDPQLHLYHYASYEPSTFKRLAAQYGTREEELDDLLRRDVPTVVIEKLGGHPALIALPCRVEKIALDLLPLFESFESFLARNAKLWRLAPLRYSRLISQTA